MNCPSCNTPNENNSRFCLRCGNPLPVQPAAPTPQTPPAAYPSQAPRPTVGPAQQVRPAGPPPGVAQPQPVNYPAQPQMSPLQGQYPPQQPFQPAVQPSYQPNPSQGYQPQPYGGAQYPQQPYAPSSSQVSVAGINIWGPFAGYGTRRRHVGWLMDNQSGRHVDLLKQVNQRLRERQIPGTEIYWRTLTARGVIVESRPYFIIQRGLVSLGLNIGAVGKDLFISMATYLKPPISNFRVILAGVSALLFVLGGPIIGGVVSGAVASVQASMSLFGPSSGPDFSFMLMPTLCCFGPLWTINGILFPLGLLYSAYKWLTEKDFFALLRVAPNEFNEDDLMSLEKAVEQTVRSALDDIGLNPADLKPTAVQGSEQRLI